jgi:low temperature requirement protein LtrA
MSTAVGVSLLVAASFADGVLQGGLWALALGLDMLGGKAADVSGWKLVPGHFAERHGLVLIIALGESIVAIGVGAEDEELTAGVMAAAVLGTVVAAALWWLYFDVVARVAERRLSEAAPAPSATRWPGTRTRTCTSRWSPGIVLLALGLKKTLGDVGEPLKLVPAVALLGGTALYLLAHVAFRLRNVHTLAIHRVVCAVVLVALVPLAVELPALATLAVLAAVLAALVTYEAVRFAEARDRVRHQLAAEHSAVAPASEVLPGG